MKHYFVILLVVFCCINITAFCEDYMLGAYLYNKNTFLTNTHVTWCDSLRSAGFNTAMCSAINTSDNTTYTMLNIMSQHGVTGILEDFIFDPLNNTYGAKTLSTGNYFRFEAEYADSSEISQNDRDHPDSYYYMSPQWNNARTGNRNNFLISEYSNGFCWQINNDQTGYAYHDLMFKFPQTNDINQFLRVGQEFRFPMSQTDGGQTGSDDIFEQNVLYITFSMRCSEIASLPDNTILAKISLNSKGYYSNETDFIPIPHIFDNPTLECDTTYVTKQMYLNSPVDPVYTQNHLLTVSVTVPRLNSLGVLINGPNFTKTLKNLNPNLYWNGYGSLRLDYIEYEDWLHRNFTDQDAVLANIRTFGLPYIYGYDEPAQGQFESFRRISRYLESHGSACELIVPVHTYNYGATGGTLVPTEF